MAKKDKKKDEKTSEKVENKNISNESILDWDLYYEANKIPITKLRKES